MSSGKPATWKQYIVACAVGIAVCLGLWFTLGGDPDHVDNKVKVQRGESASDVPNPDAQMMLDHAKGRR